jgi:3-phytase/alkaline phosphatase D
MPRALLPLALSAALALHALAQDAGARWKLTFLADVNIPTGTAFEDIARAPLQPSSGERPPDEELRRRKASGEFGGISALAWDETRKRLIALSDSTRPVFFTFSLSFDGASARLSPGAIVPLKGEGGAPIEDWQLDPEGLVLTPASTLLLSSEGYPDRTPSVQPAIFEYSLQGDLLRSIPLPPKFLAARTPTRTGIRHNRSIESLTLAPGGRRLYTALEGPLMQDGPPCGIANGFTVRILEFNVRGNRIEPAREFAYPLGPMSVPAGARSPSGAMGLVELLALGGGEFLSLERGFATAADKQTYTRILIYHFSLEGAADVSAHFSLDQAPEIRPVRKTLLLDLDTIVPRFSPGFRSLDNFEALAFGPTLPDGARTVVAASDNNYADDQRTALLLFRLDRR